MVSEVVNSNDVVPLITKEMVPVISKDIELRALRPGSDEFKAALIKKFPEKFGKSQEQKSNGSPPAATEQAEVTKVSEQNTETSKDDKGTDANAVSSFKEKTQKRIDKLTEANKHSQSEVAQLKAELEALKAGKTKPTETKADTDKKTEASESEPEWDGKENLVAFNKRYSKWLINSTWSDLSI